MKKIIFDTLKGLGCLLVILLAMSIVSIVAINSQSIASWLMSFSPILKAIFIFIVIITVAYIIGRDL